jgi:hypothetical protein
MIIDISRHSIYSIIFTLIPNHYIQKHLQLLRPPNIKGTNTTNRIH